MRTLCILRRLLRLGAFLGLPTASNVRKQQMPIAARKRTPPATPIPMPIFAPVESPDAAPVSVGLATAEEGARLDVVLLGVGEDTEDKAVADVIAADDEGAVGCTGGVESL